MRNGPRSHSSPTSPARAARRRCRDRRPAPRSPGTGRPNDPRRCSGWSVSSSLARQTLPGLGHAEHVVAQLRIARAHVGGHDRPEVAAPDRAEVAGRRTTGPCARCATDAREAVHHRRAHPFEQVEGRRRVGGVRAHERRAGEQRAEQAVGEAADPEERRVREQHLGRRCSGAAR